MKLKTCGVNKIQQTNMITLNKDYMFFFPKKLFHVNEF